MKKDLFRILPLLLLVTACAHAPVTGGFTSSPEPLTADGAAPLNEGNAQASRQLAVQDAERNALRRAAALFMDAAAGPEADQALDEGLLRTPQLYVAKYKVVSEWRDGPVYRVTVRAWLRLDRLVSALRAVKLAGPEASAPEAALAVSGSESSAFTDAFAGAFAGGSLMGLRRLPPAAPQDPSGALSAGLSAASEAGAELLFVSSASAVPSGSGFDTGFYPCRADASLSVYDVKSGKELLSLSAQASAIDSSRQASSDKALASAGELLGRQAAQKTAGLIASPAPVKIRVFGLDGLATLEKLRGQLSKAPLSGLRVDSYSDGAAVFSAVPDSSDLQEFASSVLRDDEMGLELEATGPAEVDFALVH